MTIRKLNISEIVPFDYEFETPIGGKMTDVGRNIGSATIGLNIQTVPPGNFSSRRHRHLFQEEILVVMSGTELLHHGKERLPVGPGDAVCYLAADSEAHTFENTGTVPLTIWAFGNRFRYEICEYPDHGVAFVEGLGSEISLVHLTDSDWTAGGKRTLAGQPLPAPTLERV